MIPDRRQMLQAVAALGVGTATFHRAAVARAAEEAKAGPVVITAEMVKDAEWIAGLTLTDGDRKNVAAALTRLTRNFADLRKIDLPNHIPPAIQFNPAPGMEPWRDLIGREMKLPALDLKKPAAPDDLAFLSVAKLGHLLKTKQISSVELTKLYIDRLKKYDPALLCVVSLTEEIALTQAAAADTAIAAGKYRGPLHGIPWGAKDLISYPGYKTTWGAGHYKDQTLNTKATIAERLENAGAVMVAKLTLGAIAMGDQWFGGMTRNPWNVKEGSSGSSAGSGAAVSAACVGFAIGTETHGSIVSPSTRCGVTGLRPTFGRIARTGCMALTWTMDKLGPMARSAEDCAIIFKLIHGADGSDPTAVDRPFDWPNDVEPKRLIVGVYEGKGYLSDADRKVLADLGVQFKVLNKQIDAMYERLPVLGKISYILDVEAAALFDDLTRKDVRDGLGAWPATFRRGQFITAVEYLRANRIRTLFMREFANIMDGVSVLAPFPGDLLLTNLTGHPQVCLPNGFMKRDGVEVPTSLTLTGALYEEEDLLHVAHLYQKATGHHLKRPPMEKATKENAGL